VKALKKGGKCTGKDLRRKLGESTNELFRHLDGRCGLQGGEEQLGSLSGLFGLGYGEESQVRLGEEKFKHSSHWLKYSCSAVARKAEKSAIDAHRINIGGNCVNKGGVIEGKRTSSVLSG